MSRQKRVDCPDRSIVDDGLSIIFVKLLDKPVELRFRIVQRSTSAKVWFAAT
jgi:hypothetical protein